LRRVNKHDIILIRKLKEGKEGRKGKTELTLSVDRSWGKRPPSPGAGEDPEGEARKAT